MTITLLCGDCLELMRDLPDGSVDAVVTDPPYGVGFQYTMHDDSPDEYSGIWERVFAAEGKVGRGYIAVYQPELRAKSWASDVLRDWHLIALGRNFVQGGRGDIVSATDYVLWWRIGERRGRPKDWQEVFARDWFVCDTTPTHRDPLSCGHPCPRPVDGCAYLVRCFTRPGDTILDPFMGSGTTGVACVQTGRNFIGMEIDPGYFAIAQKRIAEAQLQPALLDAAS